MTDARQLPNGKQTMNKAMGLHHASKLDNQTSKQLIVDLMQCIRTSSHSVELIERVKTIDIWGEEILQRMPGEKFPRLRLELTPEDMNELKKSEVLTDDLCVTTELAKGVLPNGQPMTALEKLLYSVLWKNGDLGKEHHIVEGVYGNEQKKRTGKVFYEFGGYLSGRNSFILDQHTLRCFAVRMSSTGHEISRARQLETVDRSDEQQQRWIGRYMAYYDALEKRFGDAASDYIYEVDRLFFGAGKLIKLGKTGSRSSKDEL